MHKLFFDAALTPDGWRDRVDVTVEAGLVTAVAPAGAGQPSGGIALPGVANLHSHTFQRGFAGLTERRGPAEDHFWTWREAMYRFAAAFTPEDVEAVAALAFAEMLESGFTAVAEFHYLHHAPDGTPYDDPAELCTRIAAAAATTGIGLTLLPVFYAHAGFGGAPPVPGQRRFVTDLDAYARIVEGAARAVASLPQARVGIAPHSLRAATLGQVGALVAAYPEGPVHIHVAEQEREIADCLAAHGARPVDLLLDHAPVDPRWCLIHATHLTEAETARLARSGAVAGLCPITEGNLGDGIFPGVAFAAAGGGFGLGTDSNVLISLTGEVRALEYGQRLRERARNRMGVPGTSTGRRLLEMARTGGARALGQPAGAIAPGGRADLVVLDPAALELHGRAHDAALDAWIFASPRGVVDTVLVGGRAVVRHGRHVARPSIEAAFRRALDRIAAA